MLACQSVLGVHDRTTHTDSAGTRALCMHSVMYDPIKLIVLAVRGGAHRAAEGHLVKPAPAPDNTEPHTHRENTHLSTFCV